jgi:hypothetical protein
MGAQGRVQVGVSMLSRHSVPLFHVLASSPYAESTTQLYLDLAARQIHPERLLPHLPGTWCTRPTLLHIAPGITHCACNSPLCCAVLCWLRCRSILNDSYRTPLHVLYPPHIIALGCLHLASILRGIDLRAWLEGLQADLNQASHKLRQLSC